MECQQGAPCRDGDVVGSRCDIPCTVPTPGELHQGGMRLQAIPSTQTWFRAPGWPPAPIFPDPGWVLGWMTCLHPAPWGSQHRHPAPKPPAPPTGHPQPHRAISGVGIGRAGTVPGGAKVGLALTLATTPWQDPCPPAAPGARLPEPPPPARFKTPRKGSRRGVEGSGDSVVPEPTAARPHSRARNRPWPRSRCGRGTGSSGPSTGESSRLPHGRPTWPSGSAAQPVPMSNSPLSAPSPPQPPSPETRMRHLYLQGQAGKLGCGDRRGGGRDTPAGMAIARAGNPSEIPEGGPRLPKAPHPRGHEGFGLTRGLGLLGR